MKYRQLSHGMACSSTRTRYPGPCYEDAAWVVYWIDAATLEVQTEFACAQHLHKLLAARASEAQFSREMFRVIPAEKIIEHIRQQQAPVVGTGETAKPTHDHRS